MSRVVLSLILILAPLVSLRGQILLPILTGPIPTGGGGTPVKIVGTCQSLGTNGGTTSAINTTGANFIAVAVYGNASGSPWAITENKGNGAATNLTNWGALNVTSSRISYWTNPTVGSGHTFTVTGTSSFSGVCIEAWSGMVTTSVFDSGTDFGTATGGTSCQAGSITPSAGNKVVIAALAHENSAAVAIDSSFTKDGDVALNPGVTYGGAIASLLQTPNGATTNPTWSSLLAGAGVTCSIAAFKGM